VWVCAPEASNRAPAIRSPFIGRCGSSVTTIGISRLTARDRLRHAGDEHLMTERRPDLVLSGINHGANVGDDVTYSGTVAAAMEATLLGVARHRDQPARGGGATDILRRSQGAGRRPDLQTGGRGLAPRM